jgi:methyl-accepting chemotaxis protein
MNTVVDMLSGMDSLTGILTAGETGTSLEEQTAGILRPYFKSVLDSNSTFFENYMGFPDGTAVTGSGYQFDYAGGWSAPRRGWYELAMTDTARAHVTSPYVDAQTGEMCVSIAQAVISNGKVVGVMAADVFVTELLNITLAATLDSTGYSMLIDRNGDILVHPDAEYAPGADGVFKNLATVKNNAHADMWAAVSSSEEVHKYPDTAGINKYYISSMLSTTGWHLVAVLPESVVTQPVTNVILIVVPISVIILAIAASFIFLTIRSSVSRPLMPITAFFNKAGLTGDFTFSREDADSIGKYSRRKDEFGQLIIAAASFVNHVNEISKALEMIAGNDLTPDIALLSEKDTMGNSLRLLLNNLNDMFMSINDASNEVSAGSHQVADEAQALAQGSTQQAASIAELSESMTEISAKTTENAERARHAASLSNTIRDNAEKGSRQMGEMISAVNDINQSSQDIQKVMKVIDDIAFQTNILALNAAVEAARAGQHGKGFAVVADEVRNLAAKSAEAAKNTEALITDSMSKSVLGVRIAGETAASFSEIVSGVEESSGIVSEIALSSEEQSQAISQINTGIDQVAAVVQQNSATAEESAATSEEMSAQSAILREMITQFKIKNAKSAHSLPMPVKRKLDAPAETGFAVSGSQDNSGKY